MAHLDAVARWLQDVAFADGIDAGLGMESAWVIRRTSLRIERLPSFFEQLELRTWCAGLAASTAERRTSIEGDRGCRLEAEAVWVHIDPATRRPARFPADFLGAFEESAAERRPRTKLRHPPEPAADAERSQWRFTHADVDVAGHVNNAVYWRVLEEAFGLQGPWAAGGTVEAEYRGGIEAGPATVARAGEQLWVLDAEGTTAATLRVEPEPANRP